MRSLITSTISSTTRAYHMSEVWATITTTIGITSDGAGCNGKTD